jgi:AcrR family transcriptional regulator
MRRRNQEPLTPERIIDAAATLAAEDGVLQLSMRRLGRRLGVDTMAIYYYFSSKEELFEALRAKMIAEVPSPNGPALTWDERIRVVMVGYRRALLRYSHFQPVFILHHKTHPYIVERIRHEHDVLQQAGFGDQSAAIVFRAVATYVNGYVLGECSDRARLVSELIPDEPGEVEETSLPHRAVGPLPAEGELNELAFECGLDAMIDGFRRLHARTIDVPTSAGVRSSKHAGHRTSVR